MGQKALAGVLVALAAVVVAAPAPAGAATKGLIAPAAACPNQTTRGAPEAVQVKAMLCMVNYARERRGRPPLARLGKLARAARGKAGDILRCDQFDHEACGREFTYWFKRVDYRGRCTAMGENIAWGTGSLGSVRNIFRAWIGSSGHRANILGNFQEIGIGLRVGTLDGNRGAHVWTQEFGSRTC
ncbi:MAG TPA: CAP domain-containing protein [Solirubrobacterales bacterium]|nr:CAP domain-containing protein [Solirubrobacterales bacterium]